MDNQTNQPAGNQTPNQNGGQSMHDSNMVMSILAYIGPLVIVSYIAARTNESVKFHIKQGLVLFSIEVIVWILGKVVPMLYLLLVIVNIGTLVLSIIGIINAARHADKKLPLVGDLSRYFSF